ncbi:hypothetical protein [Pradoshia sp.]
MDKAITINAETETSTFVEVFTAILPLILLAVIGVIIVAIVYIIKIVKHHLPDDKAAEQQLKTVVKDIEAIKQRLDRIEKEHK